ncbi:MAG TPA: hypothetical protein VGA66_10360 [Mycobacterium sp.]
MSDNNKPAGPMSDAVWRHTATVYESMDAAAEDVILTNGDVVRVWAGPVTSFVLGTCQVPGSYYSRVMYALNELGCLMRTQTGRGVQQSEYILQHAPTVEDFAEEFGITTADRAAEVLKEKG